MEKFKGRDDSVFLILSYHLIEYNKTKLLNDTFVGRGFD